MVCSRLLCVINNSPYLHQSKLLLWNFHVSGNPGREVAPNSSGASCFVVLHNHICVLWFGHPVCAKHRAKNEAL